MTVTNGWIWGLVGFNLAYYVLVLSMTKWWHKRRHHGDRISFSCGYCMHNLYDNIQESLNKEQ